jgi:hypothetical protein
MSFKQMVGFVGAFVLFLGVFCPIMSAPLTGDTSYLQNGWDSGVLLMVLAGATGLMLLLHAYKGLWVSGFVSVAVLSCSYMNVQSKASSLGAELGAVRNVLLSTDAAGKAVEMEWGWILLIGGSVLMLIAAVLHDDSRRNSHKDR